MATIINPITTVLLNREEFESGEFARFPFKYILETDGTVAYYSQLSAGRYLLSHEAKIPGLGVNKKISAPVAEFQPLAHGKKIPSEFFDQVRQFFLDVMGLGPSTYEAQIFIVWNTVDEDYRIVVPKQRVSAAAVRYDIGDLLSDEDIIICDIHSHNDMSAFFSGTDNADDKKNPWISGVFGKLSTEMQNKFRFNDGCGRHFDMKVEDVFDFTKEPRFCTPQAWLDQVEISTYTAPKNTRVSSWGEAYKFAGSPDGDDDSIWSSPAHGPLDDTNRSWLDDFTNPEDDLYDNVVDCLSESDENESKNVLLAVKTYLDNPRSQPTVLTDRESSVFVDITYTLSQVNDPQLASVVINQLMEVY